MNRAAETRTRVYVDGPAKLTLRVVRPPTTGEKLDAWYRERGLVHGSEGAEHSHKTAPRKGRLGGS